MFLYAKRGTRNVNNIIFLEKILVII